MNSTVTDNRLVLWLMQLAPAVVIVAIWQASILFAPRFDFTVGSPLGIARELWGPAGGIRFASDIAITAIETILGFLSGTVIGTFIGLLLWVSKTAFAIARPYLIALGAVPAFALGPVLIFWFGTDIWSKVALAFLSTFIIAIVQAYTGAGETDPSLMRLLHAFGATRKQIFTKIVAPSAAIWVLAGIRLNIGMALLGAFVGEFISSRAGLGHMIILAEGLYNVNQIWLGVCGLMAIAISFHACTMPIERWANRWKNS